MTGESFPAIRTPDQRIRAFVSSTLRELADERRAVRAAIGRMRLAPETMPADGIRRPLPQADATAREALPQW